MSFARLRLTLISLVAAALLSLAGASTGLAVVPGGLQNLACLENPFGTACTDLTNLGPSTNLIVSPDNRNVYVTTNTSPTMLLTFDRNADGRLTLRDCFRFSAGGTPACRTLPTANLDFPRGLAIAPDGRSVYVANSGNDRILQFNRDSDGILSPKSTPCISDTGTAPCDDARALNNPERMVIDKDGRHLYVASSISDSVTGFRIGAGGVLTQMDNGEGLTGCVRETAGEDCDDGRGLDGARALAMSRDGRFLYVVSNVASVTPANQRRSLAVITRNPTTGRLEMSTATRACLAISTGDGCIGDGELSGAGAINDVAVGRGGEIYVTLAAGSNSARVVTFDHAADGLVRRNNVGGCVHNGATAGLCSLGRGALAVPTGIVATADGEDVYVTGGAAGGVVEINRLSDGRLASRTDTRGCLTPAFTSGCTTASTLDSPAGIAVAPDGRHVYVASSTTGRIHTLRRDSSGPVCTNPTIAVQHGSVGPLPLACSDPDGDNLTFTLINPPTLGSLGALDNATRTIVYAAPQGQNGTTTFTYRARYISFGTFEETGSTTVNVEGAPTDTGGGGGGGGGGGTVVVPAGIDADGDGFFAGQECNDGNAAIRPGALEIRGNRVDENCDGIAEPFPTLTSGVVTSWDARGRRLTLNALAITQQFPSGMRVEIFCKGRPKCTFKSKRLRLGKLRRGARSVIASLSKRQRVFRAGQTVEVWVSAPGFNTKVNRYVLRPNRIPPTRPFCAIPGERTPRRVCN